MKSMPPEVAAVVPKVPSDEFYKAHYYEYMMKLFGKESESTNVRIQPPSLAPQNVHSVVGMRNVLQKRPLAKGNESARP